MTMLLSQLQQRLSTQVGHSNLLRLRLSATARLLDCRQLEQLSKGLSRQLIYTLMNSKATVNCDCPDTAHPLYELLDKRIRRQAELAQRETGVHALWLGYPLLYLLPPDGDPEQAVLAPLLLLPANISPNVRKQGQLRIKRDSEAGAVRANPLLWAWVRRHYQIQLPHPEPSGAGQSGLDWAGLHSFLEQCANCFSQAPRIDIESTLVSVPALKSPRKSPSLINAAVLGYFHWPNASLLSDLEALQQQDLSDSLLNGLLARQHPAPIPPLPAPPEADRFWVSDADFSQMQAVWQARQAPGLVIHGPPGTGKSQTIVNIIADSLAHQQSVLMVCQKQAALQVVHGRLRDAGLAPLCLHVRDADADRQSLFRDLRAQVDALPTQTENQEIQLLSHKRNQLAQQITRLEIALDKHAQAVHVPHSKLLISYREMLAQSAALSQRFPHLRTLPSVQKQLDGISAPELDALAEKILTLGHLYAQADPHRNPWYWRQPDCRLNDHLLSLVKGALAELRERNAQHLAHLDATPPLVLPEKLAAFPDFMQRIMQATEQFQAAPVQATENPEVSPNAEVIKAWWQAIRHSNQRVLQCHLDACATALKLAEEVENHWFTQPAPVPTQESHWQQHYRAHHQADLDALERHARALLRYDGAWWRLLLPAYHQARRALQALTPAGSSPRQTAENLLQFIQRDRLLTRLNYSCQTLIPGVLFPSDKSTTPEQQTRFLRQAQSALHSILWLREQEQAQPWLTPLFDGMMQNPASGWTALQQQFSQGLQRLPLAEQLLQSVGKLQTWLQPSALETPKRLVREGKDLAPWLQTLEQGLSSFPALLSLEAERQSHSGLLRGLLQALENYEQERRNPHLLAGAGEKLPQPPDSLTQETYGQWWDALLRFSALQSALNRCLQESPSLQALTPQAHADTVEKLEQALHAKRALEAEYILHTWLQAQAPLRSRPWKRIFQLRASRNSAANRMREAVAAGLEEGLLHLRPCWLTNPETAAQIFPLLQHLFDLVIFDEASQCPLEQALPIIHRGQRLIVCGDEKQLPPTGFFMAHLEETEDTATLTEDDNSGEFAAAPALSSEIDPYLLHAEDLLAATSGHLRETYLRVHYRSTDPLLIAFSNQAFYHGLLEVPPANRALPFDPQQANSPLRFQAVNGVYDKRRNLAEAEQVVARLQEHWLNDSTPPSIGVITFNQVQRDLIEDHISARCQTDPAFASAYQREVARGADSQGQGFFVKNLENVQGDERDLIIFSTTFGTDPQGRFYRRFGPLGASGGERRLNVGITRAKQGIELLCSLPLQDMTDTDAPQDSLTPAAYLQLYLQYAQAISNGDTVLAHQILQRLDSGPSNKPQQCGAPAALLQDIQAHLADWGYSSQLCLGSPSLGLDIAVQQPEKHDFLLGIECDGGVYFRERDNQLREIWRVRLLQRHGWQLHRIWSERWWNAKNTELEKLKQRLEAAQRTTGA